MFGVIKNYDGEAQAGTISNGKEDFKFVISDWIANAPPEQGDQVKFDLRGVTPYNINLYAATLSQQNEAVKRKALAFVLALFLGFVGAHRFYLGYYRIGVIQIIVNGLLLMVAGLPGYALLWGFVEAFLILGGHLDKDALGRLLK